MNKPWVHEDCLELVTNLADMNCSASINGGIMTMVNGAGKVEIDLFSIAKKERESEPRDE